jgi:UDP-N-acetylmuramyl pentapeptide phosphotransferase/UDP-N-acetylglucosamine-1-phosphate transferase
LDAFNLLIAFASTFGASLLLVMTRRWHGRFSLDSNHGIQKLHTQPTPRIGGVSVLLGLLAAYGVATEGVQLLLAPMLAAAIPAFSLGLLEDLTKKIGVMSRLIATMLSGVLAWQFTGVAMQNPGVPPIDWLLGFLPMAVVFTAFAVGGVANAVNIIDGFNGLAAGTVAIMAGAMGMIALHVQDPNLASVCFLVAAIALGFGVINWPLGKLFLGDGGAYLLGFLVAWLAVLLPMRHPNLNALATMMVCAYPVLEVGFSVRRRMRRIGHHPGQADRAHLHHFIHRRLVRPAFPRLRGTLQNGLTSLPCWAIAALPATWGVLFAQHTPMLLLGLGLAVFGYAAVYARLTQFGWCFQALTLKSKVPLTSIETHT